MTGYAALAALFLAIAALAGTAIALFSRRRPGGAALVVTAIVLFTLTAVFDNLMIAGGLFHYAEPLLLGARIGLAPLEDFAYPLAGVLLLPALWQVLRGRTSGSAKRRDPR